MLWWIASVGRASTGGTVLVGEEDPERPPVEEITARGGTLGRCFRSSRICLVRGVSPDDLLGIPGIRSSEADAPMTVQQGGGGLGTPECPDLWELGAIGAEAAWATASGLNAPVIAIQDSGFRATHQDLAGRIVDGWNYGDDNDDVGVSPAGIPEHGTFSAGLLAAVAGDGFGRIGVAPDAGLFLQRIADLNGALYFSYAIAAMDDLATAHPEVGVLSYSLSSTAPPTAFHDAVAALEAADILMVVPAGNCFVENCDEGDIDIHPIFPVSFEMPHVIGVTSTRSDGTFDTLAHHGQRSIAVAAPGNGICSLGVAEDDAILTASGTSYAVPVVAGAAALIRETWPRLTAPEVSRVLERSCTPNPDLAERVRCGGEIAADRALRVPVARLAPPGALTVTGDGELALTVDSPAAGGALWVILTHTDEIEVTARGATRFAPGDRLALPTGDEEAESYGTMVAVPLPADGDGSVSLPIHVTGRGISDATVRAIPVAGDLVGTPVPEVGAYRFLLSAELAPSTGTEPGTTTSSTTEPDTVPEEDPQTGASSGCSCATTGPTAGWPTAGWPTAGWPIGALLVALRRERRRELRG